MCNQLWQLQMQFAIEPHTHRAKNTAKLEIHKWRVWAILARFDSKKWKCFRFHRGHFLGGHSFDSSQGVRIGPINLKIAMRITQLLYILSVVIASIEAVEYLIRFETKKDKCLNPPRTARKVETVIGECQDEVRNKLVNGGP